MKVIYIATATNEDGDTVQENAYADAEYALKRATEMCKDINQNTALNVYPEIIPVDFYDINEVVSEAITSE